MRRTRTFENFNECQRHALEARRNLVVRANAGSGKTSVLVERIAQILAQSWDENNPLELTKVVAITFTRKAAAEMEERLRLTFRELGGAATNPKEQKYWADRTNELPRAMIGTIDSFCSRILREFGLLDESKDRIEPDFQPTEGYEAEVLRREAVERTINQLSEGSREDSDSSTGNDTIEACRWWAEREGYNILTKHLMRLLEHSIEPEKIVAAHRNLGSPEERVGAAWENLPAVRQFNDDRNRLKEEIQAILQEIGNLRKSNQSLQTLGDQLTGLLENLRKSDRQSTDLTLNRFREAILTDEGKPRKKGFASIQRKIERLQEKWGPLLESFAFDWDAEIQALEAADKLACLLEPAYDQYLTLCREANQYDFWTIARRTRDLLAGSPAIRRELIDRYRFVILDEFQDTNQLQWEIISWLVGNGPKGPLDKDRLFIVGDPQQSIYRFRRADVAVFSRVTERIVEANRDHGLDGVPTSYDDERPQAKSTAKQRLGEVELRENYRSLKPMPLMLMDRVFEYAFDPAIQGLDPDRDSFQINYQNLVAGVECKAPGEVCYVLADEPDADSVEVDDSDESSATQDLSGRQVQAVVDQLESLNGETKHIVKKGEANTLSWRDMAILLPSRDVVLGRLEKELGRRAIPYVVTSGIGFWQRQEIRDEVSLASFLADAGDELALFAVLRGPVGQLSDKEILFLSQLGRGNIHRGLIHLISNGESIDSLSLNDTNPLTESVRLVLSKLWNEMNASDRRRLRLTASRLEGWRQRVDRMAHADLLQRCLEESGAYAIYAADPEGELVLANLQRLFGHIRGEEHVSAPGLGRLARWMRDQVDDSLREEQAVLALGQDAVQIMTVHAAKGLEFPVVAVLKMERHVDRTRSPRLLVKSEWDQLLKEHEKDFPSLRPGTLAVSVRHPNRPRESYRPRLLKALRELERAQDLAESRRLFYVAATRAKERLILAGKPPRLKMDGTPRKRQTSWQKWFEEALGITEEEKKRGFWQEATGDFEMKIITEVAPPTEGKVEPAHPISRSINLQYLHERSRWPSIATTGLDRMRDTWRRSLDEWWRRYRVNVRDNLPKANSKSEIRNPKSEIQKEIGEISESDDNFGTLVGSMVHRMFEMGRDMLDTSENNRRSLLRAMAANLLANSRLPENADGEEEWPVVDSDTVSTVVSTVEQIIERVNKKDHDEIRRLLETPGEAEVQFLLPLGRWHITGRFDKLLPGPDGGWEIVDWKTDRESDSQNIVERYDKQMRLYALALHRTGRAALIDEAVRVHLALLYHGRVETLNFPLEELDGFAAELEKDLQEMDEFGEESAPLRVAAKQ